MKKRRIYCHGLKGVMRVVGCALNRVVVQDFVVCVQCSCYEDGQPIKSPPPVPLGASLADRHGLPSSQGESVLGQKEPKRVGRKGEAREQERERRDEHRNARVEVTALVSQHGKDSKRVGQVRFSRGNTEQNVDRVKGIYDQICITNGSLWVLCRRRELVELKAKFQRAVAMAWMPRWPQQRRNEGT